MTRNSQNTRRSPTVSIGLPVYNGAEYLELALESLLSQSWTDFELIISDNASSDDTPAIATKFVAIDDRVRYLRSDENRGASWNYARVFEQASGEFFLWASHDDLYERTFLESTVAALKADGNAIGCYSSIALIDKDGCVFKRVDISPALESTSPSIRFAASWRDGPPGIIVLALHRRKVLAQTRLLAPFSSSDRVLAGDLAIRGRFIGLRKYLFKYRRHEKQSTGANYPNRRERIAWFDPSKAGRSRFPNWRLFAEYFRMIMRANISIIEKIKCLMSLSRWMIRFRKHLILDVMSSVGAV